MKLSKATKGSDDLISRQSLLKEIESTSVWMEYDDSMTKAEIAEAALKSTKSAVMHIIENFPAEQREPAHIVPARTNGIYYTCSSCDEPVSSRDKYCWYCGKKFIEGEHHG